MIGNFWWRSVIGYGEEHQRVFSLESQDWNVDCLYLFIKWILYIGIATMLGSLMVKALNKDHRDCFIDAYTLRNSFVFII